MVCPLDPNQNDQIDVVRPARRVPPGPGSVPMGGLRDHQACASGPAGARGIVGVITPSSWFVLVGFCPLKRLRECTCRCAAAQKRSRRYALSRPERRSRSASPPQQQAQRMNCQKETRHRRQQKQGREPAVRSLHPECDRQRRVEDHSAPCAWGNGGRLIPPVQQRGPAEPAFGMDLPLGSVSRTRGQRRHDKARWSSRESQSHPRK